MFLPEDCVSTILSLTSPQDACRSCLVSSTFNSAAESDVVWERFLPSDYQELLLRLVNHNPLKHPTKKELFFHLCSPVLIDGGRKSFKIERASGKKSYLLSARELSITWSDEPMYWSWKHMTDSRFAEVVELITISWLEIHGKIRTQSLSKNTAYSAYLVMNISNRAYGLDMAPFETSVKVGNRVSYGTACVCRHDEKKQQNVDSDQTMKAKVFPGNEPIPSERNCGWTEIKLGEFFTGEEDEEVNISLMETKGYHLKAGLVIEGIEVPVLILSLFCISKLKEKINRGKEEVLVFCRNTRKTKLSSFVHFLHCFRQRLVASIGHCWRFSDRRFLHEAKFFRGGKKVPSEMDLDLLPGDCFAHILSLTSPRDACRSSLVSSSVRSMADSDSVWQKFLPSDYEEILASLVSPVVYSSNKELFLRLCSPCLIDGGKKIFSIDKSTSKKCYMLSAKELSITWGSHPLYWSWKPLPESRFAEVAELIFMWWLEICGTMSTNMLSPKTFYAAYLVVKFADRAYGLDFLPSEVSIEVGSFKLQGQVYLNPNEGRKNPSRPVEALRSRLLQEERGNVCERKDGWMEIELGSFFNGGNDKEVNISLKEVKGQHLKGGLIVEGIELRPKY